MGTISAKRIRGLAAACAAVALVGGGASPAAGVDLGGTVKTVPYLALSYPGDPTHNGGPLLVPKCLNSSPVATSLGMSVAGGTGQEAIDSLSTSAFGEAAFDDYALGRVWWDATVSAIDLYSTCTYSGTAGAGSAAPAVETARSISATGTCTQGVATAGGFKSTGPAGYALNETYPIDTAADADTIPDDGWRTALSRKADTPGTVSFDPSCVVFDHALAYRRATFTVPAHTVRARKVLCPTDRPVLGGGVRVSGAADLSHVTATRPWDSADADVLPDDGWLSRVRNTSARDLTMTVHALCE